MSLDKNDFLHLCRLSRLAPDPSVQEEMAAQCSRILAYMDKLAEVDTTGVEPLYSPVIHESAFRDDIAVRRDCRADILAGAPATDGAFFIVPRIVEGK
ncbi:Asp-tRNA(Asn)/Glu-tRNA(Gln) amidotransferase subunit GatC [Mailhella massiliensis]|uniref:Aspartyl/glutamyl-tRNA(Asn/Gln) amidotransferase subunit C n=1 Tax=Mailhella massiliensis TaxID=1903261 RepID=A0A921DSN4_9BACT|nr:Asp-tRNA(Asn)/Glu-tRNA(Gln) amidotransferase subunit GatC [Mailhella massiliensis]HJD98328.1 Asp-tRNA(Asn)/Glu-tRNA(Gln) amidotransferase subunit GatC [Mailhella massiliensis]